MAECGWVAPRGARLRPVRLRKISEKRKYGNQFRTVCRDLPRVTPRCRHAGRCGGCRLQDVAYADQVAAKVRVFWRLIGKCKVRWALRGVLPEAVASPEPFGYRQRMDYVFAFGAAGLRGADFADVVELEECHLVRPPGWRAFARARELARAHGVPDYDYRAHRGQLRYAVIRCNRAGEVLLSLVTRDRGHDAAIAAIAGRLLAEGLAVGVHHLCNDRRSDTSAGEPVACWGAATIAERLGAVRMRIGPGTFFQANPAVAEEAYARIADWLAPVRPRLGLDLYSGTGGIAAFLAGCCERVVAVESDPGNRDAALATFADNGIDNVDYRVAEVSAVLRSWDEPVDVLVLNPPRAGVGAAALRPVIDLAPARIAYMSCNALSLLADCRVLGPYYRPVSIAVLDMFPQTHHFEVLICWQRRDPAETARLAAGLPQ